jgi:hypothetical protein
MYAMARKYDIPDLSELARIKFQQGAMQWWKSRSFVLALAWMYSPENEVHAAMKEAAITVVLKHAKALYDDLQHERFRELARRTPELTKDIIRRMAERINDGDQLRTAEQAYDISRRLVQCIESLESG